MDASHLPRVHGAHIMVKPAGAFCNLNCTYCFYLEKLNFYDHHSLEIMSIPLLDQFIREYCQLNKKLPEVQFVWQGGEPMLAGLSFYEAAVEFQKRYAKGRTILNSLQTNGILLDDSWCRFLKKNCFSVGISLDGPSEITNIHRKDKSGGPAFDKIMAGIRLLQEYDIPYTVLACVTKDSCRNPLEIYHFFKEAGIRHIQFSPVVERIATDEERQLGLRHGSPSYISEYQDLSTVTDWSVLPSAYGTFLNTIFDCWSQEDVGKFYVQNFEWALASWMGLPSSVCIFSQSCGACGILEHNGEVYSCDHYMYPEYRLGNLKDSSLEELVRSPQQARFACQKTDLSERCSRCNVRFACQGECPRHRFVPSPYGNCFESYLCRDYQKFFRHIHPKIKAMAQLVSNGLPASDVMTLKDRPIVIYKKQ